MKTHSPKKVIITFGRSFHALELARLLNAAGHQIYLVDSIRTYVGRFSNAVKRCIKVPSPRFDHEGYIAALIDIVQREKIDLIIPIYEETTQLSHAIDRFPKSCQLFCPPFDLYQTLHNKWSFQCKLQELNIPTLKASLIESNEDLKHLDFTTPFAIKACYSRASNDVRKVFPNQPIQPIALEPHNPWIAQEWMEGNKFCTYSICHEGKVYAHATYPVKYAIDGNSCLIFENTTHPAILQWITDFVQKVGYTGQIAFDFIESASGQLYAIECNPRATSGLLLFDKAFFKQNLTPLFPAPHARKQIATGMLLYGWRKSAIHNNSFLKFFKALCTTKDVVFRVSDLKPFLFEPLVFASLLKNSMRKKLPIPAYYTHDHDWNGEALRTCSKSSIG
jgi:predicted ATP-grasp superfamily ATP-dependent carboligase